MTRRESEMLACGIAIGISVTMLFLMYVSLMAAP